MVRVVALRGEQLALHVVDGIAVLRRSLGAIQRRVTHRAQLTEARHLHPASARGSGSSHGSHPTRGRGAERQALGSQLRRAHRARGSGRRGRRRVAIAAARRPRRHGRALNHAHSPSVVAEVSSFVS